MKRPWQTLYNIMESICSTLGMVSGPERMPVTIQHPRKPQLFETVCIRNSKRNFHLHYLAKSTHDAHLEEELIWLG